MMFDHIDINMTIDSSFDLDGKMCNTMGEIIGNRYSYFSTVHSFNL